MVSNSDPNEDLIPHPTSENTPLSPKPTLKTTSWRWLALVLLNLALAGNSYCYDNPQALQIYLQKDLNINAESYNSLYAASSFLNIFLMLASGKLIDYAGVRVAFVLFAGIVLVGQTIVTIGGYTESFVVILIGRAIFGVGQDSLSVAETFYLTQWFGGKELAFAFSFQDVVNGVFTATNDAMSPRIYLWGHGLGLPLLVGALVCLFSFLCAVGMVVLDRYNDKVEGIEGAKTFVREGEGVNIPEMFNFPIIYWLILIYYGLQISASNGFTNVVNGYLVTRYGFNPVTAGTLIAICIYGSITVFSPIWGKLIDTFGKRVYFLFLVALLMAGAYVLFLSREGCAHECYWPVPVVPLLLLGLSISGLDSLVYPSFPIFLPERKLPTAIAGAFVVQNFAQTIAPLIVGKIMDDAPDYGVGYVRVTWLLLATLLMGLGVLGFLYVVDRNRGSRLQLVHEVFEVDDDWEANEEKHRLKGDLEQEERERRGVNSTI